MHEQLTETIGDWRAAIHVEHEARAIRNVALAGVKSQNGYRYSEAALKQAAPLYERVPVFLDHPASVQQPRSRSTRDLAGRVRNVRYEDNRLRGDIELFDTEAGRTLLALAESDGPGVGMSHVVLAERNNDGAIVEKILEVISVDAVAFPATTTTFRENTNPKCESQIRRGGRGSNDITDPNSRDFNAEPRGLAAAKPPRRRATLPGSLERLVAVIDRRLPGHVADLAVAQGLPCPGRARRVALFPRHLVVEWRFEGHPPRRFALGWTLDRAGVHFGARLDSVKTLAEQTTSWRDHLGRRPRTRLEATIVTSRRRPAANPRSMDDDAFIRTLCRQ